MTRSRPPLDEFAAASEFGDIYARLLPPAERAGLSGAAVAGILIARGYARMSPRRQPDGTDIRQPSLTPAGAIRARETAGDHA